MHDNVGATGKDLAGYRASPLEQMRIADLISLIPVRGTAALDVGARDGYISLKLADRFDVVTALDLEVPRISRSNVRCVSGDVTRLQFADNSFDVVLCAEVLEHIPSDKLPVACAEITRVTRGVAAIGVPFRQDLRVGRTTCQHCGKANPPWGHVNSFDEYRLRSLFSSMTMIRQSFVGSTKSHTNVLSTALLDFAGNPFGTWDQEEPCVHCGDSIGRPRERGGCRRSPRAWLSRLVGWKASLPGRTATGFTCFSPRTPAPVQQKTER